MSRLDIQNFETETYPELFLGEYGQQVGEMNSGLDDITLYWPKQDSVFTRNTINRDGTEESAHGGFRDAIIHWDAFDTEPDGTNISGYIAYGLIERYEELINEGDCEDITILMFKDSYSAPISSFLSLLAKRVVMVDMRTVRQTAMECGSGESGYHHLLPQPPDVRGSPLYAGCIKSPKNQNGPRTSAGPFL